MRGDTMTSIEDRRLGANEKLKKRFIKYLKNRGMTYEDWLEYRSPTKYIKMPDLKPGFLYKIKARNALFGIWLPQRNSFLISRMKFRKNYLFEEFHCDTSKWHGTAWPLTEIKKSPFEAEKLNQIEHQRHDGDLYLDYPNSEAVLEYLNGYENKDPDRQHLLNL